MSRSSSLTAATLIASTLLVASCGARSDLASPSPQTGGEGGAAGAGGLAGAAGQGGAPPCVPLGEICGSSQDCCDGAECQMGACAAPPPPCASDTQPVQIAGDLSDPYSLGADGTSLFVGQLAEDRPLLRIPKLGGPAEVLVDHVSFAGYITVEADTVFYTDESSLRSVPAAGGSSTSLTSAFGPAGFALTKETIYLAEYLGQNLVVIDRASLKKEIAGSGLSGIYRVAATDADVYFSTFGEGLHHYDVKTDKLDVLVPGLGSPRAVRVFDGTVYFTVPKDPRIYRLIPGTADSPELVADLSGLGVYIEALESDGAFVYTTLLTGQGPPGLIVRAPLAGGDPEIVAKSAGGSPSALVVDGACIYWTERDIGAVYRFRKP